MPGDRTTMHMELCSQQATYGKVGQNLQKTRWEEEGVDGGAVSWWCGSDSAGEGEFVRQGGL
jgi:hypothetical protein